MPERYGTVTDFKSYHAARNHDIAPMADDEIESALLVASEWLDARFRTRFSGLKIGGREQFREWPRVNAVDRYRNELIGIPREIEHATYEAAAIEGAAPGALSINYTPGKYKSVAVDGAISVVYASISSIQDAQTQFAIINEILSTILTGAGVNPYVGESVRW